MHSTVTVTFSLFPMRLIYPFGVDLEVAIKVKPLETTRMVTRHTSGRDKNFYGQIGHRDHCKGMLEQCNLKSEIFNRCVSLCRGMESRIAWSRGLGIVKEWRAGLARFLIQCSNEKRQLVEGSFGKKRARRNWTESHYFPCLGVLLRSRNALPNRDSRSSRQGQFSTFSLSELPLRLQDS